MNITMTAATAQAGLISGINEACTMLASPNASSFSYAVSQKEAEISKALNTLMELGFGEAGVAAFSGSGVHTTVANWVARNGLNREPRSLKPQLLPSNPNVITFGSLEVNFQRTLRLPDNGKTYDLPAGFGNFPLRRVEDLRSVPEAWAETGGVVMPMYQREAMWISFGRRPRGQIPYAVKVAAGKINAVSGTKWSEGLAETEKDYVVAPTLQYWLDGFNAGKDGNGTDVIRQFVAMPLGMGYTVEGQLTGEEKHGGLQLMAYGLKPDALSTLMIPSILQTQGALLMALQDYQCFIPAFVSRRRPFSFRGSSSLPELASLTRGASSPDVLGANGITEMGLAQGGLITQQIFADTIGFDAWDTNRSGKLYVRLVDSQSWRDLTGESAPDTPVTKRMYETHHIPWFVHYDEDATTSNKPTPLAQAGSLATIDKMHDFKTDAAAPVDTDKGPTITIPTASGAVPKDSSKPKSPGDIDEGKW